MYPLKLFTAEQIKQWDAFTIKEKEIDSIELMENAAMACTDWLLEHCNDKTYFTVICGMGNNGGDGLAIARLLSNKGKSVLVYVIKHANLASKDFYLNEARLIKDEIIEIKYINKISELREINSESVIIDAILGTGLNRVVDGLIASCIHKINKSQSEIIAIDIPSGLFSDKSSVESDNIVIATHTLSFQIPKKAFLYAENEAYTGRWHILNIGLSQTFYNDTETDEYLLDKSFVKSLIRPLKKFDHKGKNGHALLAVGSKGKIGAAVLAASAGLRSGLGLLSIQVPACGYTVLQTTVPEAMVIVDKNENILSNIQDSDEIDAIGIGPGIGTMKETKTAFKELLQRFTKALVIDADGLNILSEDRECLRSMPNNSVLTPHLKEFDRLIGKGNNDFETHQKQIKFSKKHQVYVLLKGAHSCLTCPDGKSYYNNTGNEGMAKGGSGDILTGLLTGLIAQAYSPLDATLIAVFVHGKAGDIATSKKGKIAVKAGDIVEVLPEAFKYLTD